MTSFALIRWKYTLFAVHHCHCFTLLTQVWLLTVRGQTHSHFRNYTAIKDTSPSLSQLLSAGKKIARKSNAHPSCALFECVTKKTKNSPYLKSGSCQFFSSSSVNRTSQLSPGAVNGHLAKQIPCKRAPRLPSTSAASSIRLLQLLSLRRLTFWTQTVELTQCWQIRL